MRKITILGSTGSIGQQTLDVVRHTHCAEIKGLAAGSNTELLLNQILEFEPEIVSVSDGKKALSLSRELKSRGIKTEVMAGAEGNVCVAAYKDSDMLVNAVMGSVGLLPTVEAIKAKKDIALANKETLVAAGEIIMKLVRENGVSLIPIDSEHSAILQCLQESNGYEKIYLTASGGPFRGKTLEEMNCVMPDEALAHPNWLMGKKITIDSATMMNKGLEFIEAKWLFDAKPSQIEILVHPQSIIHSMVEFKDGAIIAQLGAPDMRTPIQYALTYPNRVQNNFPRLNLFENNTFTFERPDFVNFPCLSLAIDAIREGGVLPAVMSAANEIAVNKFLNGEINFTGIHRIIEMTMSAYTNTSPSCLSLPLILEAEAFAVRYAGGISFV